MTEPENAETIRTIDTITRTSYYVTDCRPNDLLFTEHCRPTFESIRKAIIADPVGVGFGHTNLKMPRQFRS